MSEEVARTGLYERAVGKITDWVKPYLHNVTQNFVAKSVEKYAKNNPEFARKIEFEVRRRGDGAGLTQDVAEPLLWAAIKTVAALAIVIPVEFMKNKKFVLIERVAATSILLNNAVELFRLVPRFKAGLQGSLEMAKDRQRAIEETGVDPFNNQQNPREIARRSDYTKTITPTTLIEQSQKTSEQARA